MIKARTLLILGIWVALLPYSGFPYFWKNLLFSLTGLGIIFFSYILYLDYRKTVKPEEDDTDSDSFSENGNWDKPEANTERGPESE